MSGIRGRAALAVLALTGALLLTACGDKEQGRAPAGDITKMQKAVDEAESAADAADRDSREN